MYVDIQSPVQLTETKFESRFGHVKMRSYLNKGHHRSFKLCPCKKVLWTPSDNVVQDNPRSHTATIFRMSARPSQLGLLIVDSPS